MKKNNLTYESSGVNIKAADNFVKYISSLTKKRRKINNYQKNNNLNHFCKKIQDGRSTHISFKK